MPMNKGNTNFGFYLVAFVDILGQKHVLDNFDKAMSPGCHIKESDLIQRIQESFGVVEKFKIGFLSFLEQFCKISHIPSLPPNLQEKFEKIRKTNFKLKRFSDSFTFYIPLFDDDFPVPTNSIYAVMASIAVQSLLQLASGHPIRGGIDIGFGAEIDDLFYGPGLFRAYYLESKVAEYPRVVVGNKLIDYLNSHLYSKGTNIYDIANKKLASDCLHLIERDNVGISFIDLFAPEIVKMNKEISEIRIYQDASDFVQKCILEFKDNPKLLARYKILAKYFKTNLKLL